MTLVDTNILVDVLGSDPVWGSWSAERLTDAASAGQAKVNVIVLAEISRYFAAPEDLEVVLSRLRLAVAELDTGIAHLAGRRFAAYWQERDDRSRVLPDFFIGAHAVSLSEPLLTRDPRHYRRHFPELTLITPETHP